jgi:hypothetical protein
MDKGLLPHSGYANAALEPGKDTTSQLTDVVINRIVEFRHLLTICHTLAPIALTYLIRAEAYALH